MPARCVLLFSVFLFVATVFVPQAQAITFTSDPQYLVMNFSTINELNWAAPEAEWQQVIKPQIVKELDEMLAVLPPGSANRKLAWSTLMEYMNFPLDEAGPESAYTIKTRRIFEIATEKNLPVFLPLNGFQWWDELPELYNWWDPDGTHTAESFFERQDNPEDFKRRFIAGYNPENKWNVEWQSWSQPMELNWRNWGGGGFRLAPPPNLVAHHHPTTRTYRQVMEARLTAILEQVVTSVNELEAQNKGNLFAGITLGTEISLNASATPKDEFMPYGYRAMADFVSTPEATLSADLQQLRADVVEKYLFDLSRLAHRVGIPKQRVYTHVWGEAPPTDPKYAPYAVAAFNPYSRPGMSFYGYAEDPYASPSWQSAQTQFRHQNWGAVEYSVPQSQGVKALTNTLIGSPANSPPAKVIILYNWSEHKNTPAIPALVEILGAPIAAECQLTEVLPHTPDLTTDPQILEWAFVDPSPANQPLGLTLKLVKGLLKNPDQLAHDEVALPANEIQFATETLPPGIYTWYVEATGCQGSQLRTSEPRVFIKSHLTTSKIPSWVTFILDAKTKLEELHPLRGAGR
jgi:hypothetical protein